MKITLISAAVTLAMGLTATQLQAQEPTTGSTATHASAPAHNGDANNELIRPERMEDNLTTNHNDMHDDNIDAIDAEEFVETASAKGLAEIETSNMALRDGSPALHEFANKMIENHRAANTELRQIAQRENFEMADDATLMDQAKALILDIRDESFDEAYIENQVAAHEDAVELYQRATKSDNAQVRAYAQQKLPVLQEHLSMALQLRAQYVSNN